MDEQRKHRRVRVNVPSLVAGEDGVASHYLVENLSAGGALLVGNPPFFVGESLEIFLRFSEAHVFHLEGRVARRELAGGQAVAFGVSFHAPSTAMAAYLYDGDGAILGAGLRGPQRTLVVAAERTACRTVVRDLRRIHSAAMAATCSEDALGLVEHSPDGFWQIVATARLHTLSGVDLLGMIASRWPDIHRVLLCANATVAQDMLMTSCGDGRVHDVVAMPLEHESLQRLVRPSGKV